MSKRKSRTLAGMLSLVSALCFAGCQTAPQPAVAVDKHAAEQEEVPDEAQAIADASLGKETEILARGDLTLNGREQLLIANRYSAGARTGKGDLKESPVFVTRAAVLEKNDGKWSEILLCDEYLKNPSGYLGGSSAVRTNGWRLEYRQDAKQGLEMKFTPAEKLRAANANGDESSTQIKASFDVRWNRNAKRYQTYDQSHDRYLSEVPALETRESVLK
jgi:hypothetical protein